MGLDTSTWKVMFVCAAGAVLTLLGAADMHAQSAASPFPDPPGYHGPSALPEPAKPAVKPQPDRPNRPWVQLPSPHLAAKLRGWQLKFMPGDKTTPDPASGVFSSFAYVPPDATVRLVNVERSVPISLTPVEWRTRYVPRNEARTDPNDKVITKELIDILSGPEILRFIASEHFDSPRLNVEKNVAVVLVQEFDVALRTPGRKEHVWSINWRVETDPGKPEDYVGYEAWGLFTKVDGILKPFYQAVRDSWSSGENTDYFYILATGDLDGDGIDEMVAREMIFEAEDDYVQLWAWERGVPVRIQKIQ